MHPVLFKVGNLAFYSYGIFLALGIIAILLSVILLSRTAGLSPYKMFLACLIAVIAGYFGARCLYAITQFADNPLTLQTYVAGFRQGGVVWYGSLIFGIPAVLAAFRLLGLPRWRSLDVGIVGLPLGQAIGRIGCFCAGCCHGSPTNSFISVKFYSAQTDAALRGVPVHPTQLYFAVVLCLLFLFLLHQFRHKKFDGQIVLLYCMGYSVIRSLLELFRGDDVSRKFVVDGFISTSQFISIVVFVVAALVWHYRSRQYAMN